MIHTQTCDVGCMDVAQAFMWPQCDLLFAQGVVASS